MSDTFASAYTAGRAKDSIVARNSALREGDNIDVKIFRSNPGSTNGRYDRFEVPYQKWMRVLDVLNYVSENLSSDLAYRWFCGTRMCGTCAVRVNGREVLACWEAAEPAMTIEPLRNVPVLRDLYVDRAPFDRKIREFEPWLERRSPYAGFPESLSHKDMTNSSAALDCIGCMACYSACPVIGLGSLVNFAGPGPLVQLAQTALDPRNSSAKVRQSLGNTGIFNCVSCYKCEEVCPAKIPIVTNIIEPLKVLTAQLHPHAAKHSKVFRDIIRRRGRISPAELVFRVQGLSALRSVMRALTLVRRGKIDLASLLLNFRSSAAHAARRLLK